MTGGAVVAAAIGASIAVCVTINNRRSPPTPPSSETTSPSTESAPPSTSASTKSALPSTESTPSPPHSDPPQTEFTDCHRASFSPSPSSSFSLSPLPIVKPLPRYIASEAPSLPSQGIVDPSESPLFADEKIHITRTNWLERDPEAMNLVNHDYFVLSPAKIDSEVLKTQVANKERVAYCYIDLMDRSDYDQDTNLFNPRPKDLEDPDKKTLRGVLSPYHIRNPSIVAAGSQGPKAIPIPLLPKNSPDPLKDLEKMKRMLNAQLPYIRHLINKNYKFVVVGQKKNQKTTQNGFPLHHGLGVKHGVQIEEWYKVIHQFLFEISSGTAEKQYEDDL
eukprot:GHVT01062029.1.p1 GENE.GHVT01062029.1~~GHVT01062029.1.p1  ORF type:complete len:334 (+),score=44.17 GHVT01062029.1:705-1706(+)